MKNNNFFVETVTISRATYDKLTSRCRNKEVENKELQLGLKKAFVKQEKLLDRINTLTDGVVYFTIKNMEWAFEQWLLETILEEEGMFKEEYDIIKKYGIDVDRFKMAIQDRYYEKRGDKETNGI